MSPIAPPAPHSAYVSDHSHGKPSWIRRCLESRIWRGVPGRADEQPAHDEQHLLPALTGALSGALLVAVLLKLMVFAPPKPLYLPLAADCSLSESVCDAALPDGGRLEFTLSPQPVALLKPLNVELRIDGSTTRAVEVDFTGVNLAMAFNRADLKDAGSGTFNGTATLPLCSTTRMEWRATVLLESAGKKIYLPFRFFTDAAPASP